VIKTEQRLQRLTRWYFFNHEKLQEAFPAHHDQFAQQVDRLYDLSTLLDTIERKEPGMDE
jgi:hypothetical protein